MQRDMNGTDAGESKLDICKKGRVLVRELHRNDKFIPKVAEVVLEFRCRIAYIQLARFLQQMAK